MAITRLFLLVSDYTAPLDRVDPVRQRHLAWVAEQYEAGHFFISGRLVPSTGGVIIMTADSRQHAESLIADDPYVVEGLAKYAISEFEVPSSIALSPEFDAFAERVG